VTQTALAIRDADELEVAASVLDAALRRAKAEGVREASEIADQVHTALWTPPQRACCSGTAAHIKALIDARAAQIEEGE